jgi:hypothetical protein
MDAPLAKEPLVTVPPATKRSPVQKTPRSYADGFFPSDIPGLLAKADRESGDGEYDAAERHYKIVQALDPSNRAARDGRRRNEARRSERQ